jgi:IclR family transcriptional regulator, KDG regulon repressor
MVPPRVEASRSYIVLPVFKALRVLELVAEKRRDVSLTEVSTTLGLPKTTTFRYLRTLSATGFLRYDVVTDLYAIGVKFRALARVDSRIQNVRSLALPAMRELMEQFNETINLGIPDGGDIVYIEMAEPSRNLRMQARIGQRHPLHSTALGKAVLAYLPPKEQDALLSSGLKAITLNTITDAVALRRQLSEVRAQGYAIEIEETEEGAMCIGAPILDEAGRPVAALSVAAPRQRMGPDLVTRAANALRAASCELSASLDFRPGVEHCEADRPRVRASRQYRAVR